MRISYVGNFAVPFSTENHIAKAWENLGHEVQRIPEQSLEWRDLGNLVTGDLFLWTRTAGYDPPNYDFQRGGLESVKVPKVGYHLDRWWGLARETTEHGPRDPDPSPFFTHLDLLCTADGGDNPWPTRHVWFPPAILGDETELGVRTPRYTADVAFVGNLLGYGHAEWAPYRQRLHDYLRQKYGARFVLFPGRGRPQIRGRELANLYATAKVLIGDSCLVGTPYLYWSDRIPESLGRGGFLIHPYVEGLREQFPDLTTYTLGDFDELGSLIDDALGDEGFRIENRMRNRAHTIANHTYEVRCARLLTLI